MQHRERRDSDLHPVELRHQQDEPRSLRALQVRPQHLRPISTHRRNLLPVAKTTHQIVYSGESKFFSFLAILHILM